MDEIIIGDRVIQYFRRNSVMDYSSALAWCDSLNGELPIPTSINENKFLRSLGSSWLGVSATMKGLVWTNWGTGARNGNADGVQLQGEDGQWIDGNNEVPTTCYLSVKGKVIISRVYLFTPFFAFLH